MAESEESYQEWDAIFKEREEYLQENPEARDIQRSKTYLDEEDEVRCTKCGSTDDIGGCIDCKTEKDFLNEK